MEKTFYLNIIFAVLSLFVFAILFDDGKVNDTPLKERFFDFLNKMRELYFPSLQRFYYSAKHNEWLAKLNEDGGMLDFGGHYEYDYLTGRHEYVYGEPKQRKNRRVFMGGFEYTEWVSTDGIEPLTDHFGILYWYAQCAIRTKAKETSKWVRHMNTACSSMKTSTTTVCRNWKISWIRASTKVSATC